MNDIDKVIGLSNGEVWEIRRLVGNEIERLEKDLKIFESDNIPTCLVLRIEEFKQLYNKFNF